MWARENGSDLLRSAPNRSCAKEQHQAAMAAANAGSHRGNRTATTRGMPLKRASPPTADFKYYDLCRRNHDQGRRHCYFPAHLVALTATLSRFRSKLSEICCALLHRSPTPLFPPLVPLLLLRSHRHRQPLRLWEKGCESSSTEAETLTEGPIGPSLGPLKDIQNESTSKNLDNFVETDIPSFSNTAPYVVMPLQNPTNGVCHPSSTGYAGYKHVS